MNEHRDPVLGWLQLAALDVPGTQAARRFRDLVDSGNPELALRLFQEAGDDRGASGGYWTLLKNAADLLKLWPLKSAFAKRLKKFQPDTEDAAVSP